MGIDLIRIIVGQPPAGYEPLEYVAALIIGLFVIKIILEMFYFVLNLIKK